MIEYEKQVKVHFVGGEYLIMSLLDWMQIEKKFSDGIGAKVFQSFLKGSQLLFTININNITFVEVIG